MALKMQSTTFQQNQKLLITNLNLLEIHVLKNTEMREKTPQTKIEKKSCQI